MKPIEHLTGSNASFVRYMLGKRHCSISYTDGLRMFRRLLKPGKLSPELRRGLVACVVATINQQRAEYVEVMHRRGYKAPLSLKGIK